VFLVRPKSVLWPLLGETLPFFYLSVKKIKKMAIYHLKAVFSNDSSVSAVMCRLRLSPSFLTIFLTIREIFFFSQHVMIKSSSDFVNEKICPKSKSKQDRFPTSGLAFDFSECGSNLTQFHLYRIGPTAPQATTFFAPTRPCCHERQGRPLSLRPDSKISLKHLPPPTPFLCRWGAGSYKPRKKKAEKGMLGMVLILVKNIHTGQIAGAKGETRQQAWEKIKEEEGWEVADIELILYRIDAL
jgi:hypothetical protein